MFSSACRVLHSYALNGRSGILVASGAETCRIDHQAALQHQRLVKCVIAIPDPNISNFRVGFEPNWGGAQAIAASLARIGIQVGVLGIAAGSGYAGYQIGTKAQQNRCGC